MALSGSVKRNVIASWGTHASNLMLGLFVARYTLDVLGVSSYGSWLLLNSIAGYGALLYCGLGETASRFVAKYHSEGNTERINQIVSVIFASFMCLGGVAFLCACVLSATAHLWGEWTDNELIEARITLLILGVNVAVGMTGSVFGGVLHGLRRFDLERGVGFVFDLIRVALFVLFLRREYGIVIIAGIYSFVTLGEIVSYYILAHRLIPTFSVRWKHLNRNVFEECASFSSMAFLGSVATMLINATDLITIGLILGKGAIVPYYFGLRLAQFARQPIEKIAHICMPTAGALQGVGDRSKRNRFLVTTLGVVFLLVGGAFIGGWFFGGDVIRLWAGPKLTNENLVVSHRILAILLGAQLVALPCGILRAFLFGSGIAKAPAMIYLVEAALNLGLSIVLCRIYGIEGVAWGTTIPVVVVELGVLVPFALRKLGVSLWRIAREAMWPQVLPLLAILGFAQWVTRQPWGHGDWRILVMVSISSALILGFTIWLRRRLNAQDLAAV